MDGIHLIGAYYASLGTPQHLIISETGRDCAEIKKLITQMGHQSEIKVWFLSDPLFAQLSPVKTPTGVIACITIPDNITNTPLQNKDFCVLLETIQDPGNLGSILRSAAAAGVSDVYLSIDCADVWSPKTLRAAMGAHFLLTIHQQSKLTNIIKQFNGEVIATAPQAKRSLYQLPLTGPIAFVFGNEGAGLSNEILQITNQQIMIPMPGKTESLNAAAAVAVCLFERVRQINEAQIQRTTSS